MLTREARGPFWPEPKGLHEEHGRRPDGIIYGRSRTMIDVSIVTSTCKSYTAGKRTVTANISKRESDKVKKYKDGTYC